MKLLQTSIIKSEGIGFGLALLRLRQNLREIRQNSSNVQNFIFIFLKQIQSKSKETLGNKGKPCLGSILSQKRPN